MRQIDAWEFVRKHGLRDFALDHLHCGHKVVVGCIGGYNFIYSPHDTPREKEIKRKRILFRKFSGVLKS